MNANCLEVLVLLTAGAVAPYVLVALVTWLQQCLPHLFGAVAPLWARWSKPRAKQKCASCRLSATSRHAT